MLIYGLRWKRNSIFEEKYQEAKTLNLEVRFGRTIF